MALDFPAAGLALWALCDAGGPRPEYVLPVLWAESNFSPSVTNSLGYSGVNQASTSLLQSYGIDSSAYVTWAASQQITKVVTPFWLAIVKAYGPLNSGTRVYQANFLPATLGTATDLSSILAGPGGSVYAANSGLDWQHTGTIKVSDMAHSVAMAASNPQVQAAIASTYALRPSETPRDPVYGTDFGMASGTPIDTALRVGAALTLSGGIAIAIYDGMFDGLFAQLRRLRV